MKDFFKRMIGAASMNAMTYEEVEADPSSSIGAIIIVLLASVAGAVGSGVLDPLGILGATVAFLITWLVWVGLTFFIGTRLLPGPETRSSFGEILRTTGFSATPGILRVLGLLPGGIGLPIFLGVTVWMLFTFVIAIRQALDYSSTGRAIAVCILGWLIHGLLFLAFVRVAI
jgi:hypothetical protein